MANLTKYSFLKLSEGLEEFHLENGLKVLIKPVDKSNAVSVWAFYHVGSRDEIPGITGASHWCEHMLFKGGGKLAKGDVFKLISSEGGSNNAFTDRDLTAYFETLPKEKLDLGLFIESERMANSAFEPREVESERQVIISEREGAENSPSYQVKEELFAVAFHVHPYGRPVVGWKSDLERMTRDDLFMHYSEYYHPDNAVLVISGNVDLRTVRESVSRYFSGISPGAKRSKNTGLVEPKQQGERTSRIKKSGALDHLAVGFHTPSFTHEEIPALVMLTAILGGWQGLVGFFGNRGGFVPKSNRLYRRLVEGKIASEITLDFPVTMDPGLLCFEAIIMPTSSISNARTALEEEFSKAQDSVPSEDEIKVALNQIRAWHAYENDGVASKALTLGLMEILGDKSLGEKLLGRTLTVSPEDVKRVAQRYLDERNRTFCSYEVSGR